ncbi:MAG: adenylyl-sulfate kinase [Deltaproteobacteria bacterium]|jgi:adenylyl-sulfate kinase
MSFILWFTGLSGAGKSTLAQSVSKALRQRGVGRLEVLDGDEVRTHISAGLGFSREDRRTNILRIGYVARLLSRNGTVAITAAISPYTADREEVRAASSAPFVEVYAAASLEAVAARDVKGLYKKAFAGEIQNFTGVSDPYEAPSRADIVVDTGTETVEESTRKILAGLESLGLIEKPKQQSEARP